MAIRLKSQQCLARQVCAASPDTCSTAGCSPAVCGQAVACLPGAAAVPLGRSGETSWLGSNERTGARACLVLSALRPAPSGAEQEGQGRGATAMGDAPYSPASWVPPAQSQWLFCPTATTALQTAHEDHWGSNSAPLLRWCFCALSMIMGGFSQTSAKVAFAKAAFLSPTFKSRSYQGVNNSGICCEACEKR